MLWINIKHIWTILGLTIKIKNDCKARLKRKSIVYRIKETIDKIVLSEEGYYYENTLFYRL